MPLPAQGEKVLHESLLATAQGAAAVPSSRQQLRQGGRGRR